MAPLGIRPSRSSGVRVHRDRRRFQAAPARPTGKDPGAGSGSGRPLAIPEPSRRACGPGSWSFLATTATLDESPFGRHDVHVVGRSVARAAAERVPQGCEPRRSRQRWRATLDNPGRVRQAVFRAAFVPIPIDKDDAGRADQRVPRGGVPGRGERRVEAVRHVDRIELSSQAETTAPPRPQAPATGVERSRRACTVRSAS